MKALKLSVVLGALLAVMALPAAASAVGIYQPVNVLTTGSKNPNLAPAFKVTSTNFSTKGWYFGNTRCNRVTAEMLLVRNEKAQFAMEYPSNGDMHECTVGPVGLSSSAVEAKSWTASTNTDGLMNFAWTWQKAGVVCKWEAQLHTTFVPEATGTSQFHASGEAIPTPRSCGAGPVTVSADFTITSDVGGTTVIK
jgi:hypothetical protein